MATRSQDPGTRGLADPLRSRTEAALDVAETAIGELLDVLELTVGGWHSLTIQARAMKAKLAAKKALADISTLREGGAR